MRWFYKKQHYSGKKARSGFGWFGALVFPLVLSFLVHRTMVLATLGFELGTWTLGSGIQRFKNEDTLEKEFSLLIEKKSFSFQQVNFLWWEVFAIAVLFLLY